MYIHHYPNNWLVLASDKYNPYLLCDIECYNFNFDFFDSRLEEAIIQKHTYIKHISIYNYSFIIVNNNSNNYYDECINMSYYLKKPLPSIKIKKNPILTPYLDRAKYLHDTFEKYYHLL